MQHILFLTDDREDYLADSLLHGLISLGTHEVIDFPKKEVLYQGSFTEDQRHRLYGNGFTLYGLLQQRRVDRTLIWKRLETGWCDLVILGNIWRQFGLLNQLTKSLEHQQTRLIILDGDDDPRHYSVSATRLKEHGLRLPSRHARPIAKLKTFKRELDANQPQHWHELILPPQLRPRIRDLLGKACDVPIPCSFSIPAQWIRTPDLKRKKNLLPTHIVDQEVREYFGKGQTAYPFINQQAYFDDLAAARYGITTKRAGWDCLRHYEIAAAGSVVCFRDLDQKPPLCAPHGLTSTNCIIYDSATTLKRKLEALSEQHYADLLEASHDWIHQNTTTQAATRLLDEAWK